MNNTYQLSKIRQSLQRVKDSLLRDRLQMVQGYYELGTFRDAARRCGCAHTTVKYWKDRYEGEGLKGLRSIPPPGRPRELGAKVEERLRQEVMEKTEEEGWQTKQIREYIRKKGNVTYTERHTIRIAQRWGLALIKPRPQYAHSKLSEREAFLKEKQETAQA